MHVAHCCVYTMKPYTRKYIQYGLFWQGRMSRVPVCEVLGMCSLVEIRTCVRTSIALHGGAVQGCLYEHVYIRVYVHAFTCVCSTLASKHFCKGIPH